MLTDLNFINSNYYRFINLNELTKFLRLILKVNKYKNKYLWIFNDMNFYFYGREWQKKENLFVDDDDHNESKL